MASNDDVMFVLIVVGLLRSLTATVLVLWLKPKQVGVAESIAQKSNTDNELLIDNFIQETTFDLMAFVCWVK